MTNITIDGKEYDPNDLSDEVKSQLVSLQFVDSELSRLNARIAVLQTARHSYGEAIPRALNNEDADRADEISIGGLGDTLNFD